MQRAIGDVDAALQEAGQSESLRKDARDALEMLYQHSPALPQLGLDAGDVRTALFRPTPAEAERDYPRLLRVPRLVAPATALLYFSHLGRDDHWEAFSEAFCAGGGAIALAQVMGTPKHPAELRGQALQCLLAITGSSKVDWFAAPRSETLRRAFEKLFCAGAPLIDAAVRCGARGGALRAFGQSSLECLQLLAFWLSWARVHYGGPSRSGDPAAPFVAISPELRWTLETWCEDLEAGASSEALASLQAALLKDFGACVDEGLAAAVGSLRRPLVPPPSEVPAPPSSPEDAAASPDARRQAELCAAAVRKMADCGALPDPRAASISDRGPMASAAALLKECISLGAGHAEAFYRLSQLQRAGGDVVEAARTADVALAIMERGAFDSGSGLYVTAAAWMSRLLEDMDGSRMPEDIAASERDELLALKALVEKLRSRGKAYAPPADAGPGTRTEPAAPPAGMGAGAGAPSAAPSLGPGKGAAALCHPARARSGRAKTRRKPRSKEDKLRALLSGSLCG